jgi:hypothetical protein
VRRVCLRPRAHLHLQARVLDLAFHRHASTLARCPYRPLPTPCPVGHVEAFIRHSDAPPLVWVTANTLSSNDLRAVDG